MFIPNIAIYFPEKKCLWAKKIEVDGKVTSSKKGQKRRKRPKGHNYCILFVF